MASLYWAMSPDHSAPFAFTEEVKRDKFVENNNGQALDESDVDPAVVVEMRARLLG